jgi:hypothetical protein
LGGLFLCLCTPETLAFPSADDHYRATGSRIGNARGRIVMSFRAAFIAHVPDADPARHRTVLETDLYKLFSVLVKDQQQAVEVCRRLVADEGVQSILLCPGNTHADVAGIVAAVGDGVSVSVARGDSPSMRIAAEAMRSAGWFAPQPQA